MRRFVWGRRCKAEIVMDERLAAVTVSGLVKDFPGVRAIDHLSFEVAHNEIFGIVGPDGAGKTTTMRISAGVLAPDSGHATVAGCDVARDRKLSSISLVTCRSASGCTRISASTRTSVST